MKISLMSPFAALKKAPFICFLYFFSISSPGYSAEDKGKIIAMSNWASVNFSNLFHDSYGGPYDGFGYRYTCFTNMNCIGIKGEQVDILIDGQIQNVGSVEFVLNLIKNSNNGILNLSSSPVSDGIIPSIFSPAKGDALEIGEQVISITWQVIFAKDTEQQELCDFSIIINSSDPTTVTNATFTRQALDENGEIIWSLFPFDTPEIPNMMINYSDRSLIITEDVDLPVIFGHIDALTIVKSSKLYF